MKLDLSRNHIFHSPGVRLTIEASIEVVLEHNLSTLEGEQYDHIDNVISVERKGRMIEIQSCRSHRAWKAGEPNAGRGTWTFRDNQLEAAYVANDN